MELQSVVGGLPCCVIKQIEAQEILKDTQALKTISEQMGKAQLKALLQGVSHFRGGPSPSHPSNLTHFVVPKRRERLKIE